MPSRSYVSISVVAALLSIGLSGCGAGLDPETYRERPTVDAAIASVGDLELRNVSITPPPAGTEEFTAGGEVTARLSIVNVGDRSDVLTSVSTPAANTVELLDPKGEPMSSLAIPGSSAVDYDTFSVRLSGLVEPLRPGQSIPMTFTFTNNGRETLIVPVGVYTVPEPAPSKNPFEHEGGHG